MKTMDGGTEHVPGEDIANAGSESSRDVGRVGAAEQSEKADTNTNDTVPASPATASSGEQQPRRRRGFAAMDRRLVSEIARKGGKAAHAAGTAHEFTSEEARLAGGKGGRATHENRRRLAERRASEQPRGSGA